MARTRVGDGTAMFPQPARRSNRRLHVSAPDIVVRAAVVVAGVALAVVAAVTPARAVDQRHGRSVSGEDFARIVSSRGIDTDGLTIAGDVDLRATGPIDHLVRCHDCTITGSLLAADVEFRRVVDLSGLRLQGALDLHGATFRDAFLLQRTARRWPLVVGSANLQVVTFAHRTTFDGARFQQSFDARYMTARGDSSFSEAAFGATADFAHALFQRTANLTGTTFVGRARFNRALFGGPTSVQQSSFLRPVEFQRVRFDAGADLSFVEFGARANFDRAFFGSATSFRYVQSLGLLSMKDAQVRDALDFDHAYLAAGISLPGVVTSGVLSLRGALIDHRQTMRLEPLRATSLLFDIADTTRIAGPLEEIAALEILEDTATAGDELRLANEARYRLLALQGGRQPRAQRLLDAVFYRAIAGYLVRPTHPLSWLVVVLAIASLARAIGYWRVDRRQRQVGDASVATPPRRRRLGRDVRAAGSALVAGGSESIRRALTRGGGGDESPLESTAAARATAVESFAYRALVALLLISIGNSSATIREVIDAIHG